MYRSAGVVILGRRCGSSLQQFAQPTKQYSNSVGDGGGGDLTTSPPKLPVKSFGNCKDCGKPLKPAPTLTREFLLLLSEAEDFNLIRIIDM